MKHLINFTEPKQKHAGSKAKDDIANILINNGFNIIDINRKINKIQKAIIFPIKIKKKLKSIAPSDYVYIQYPIYSNLMSNKIIKLLKKRGTKNFLIVHDVESFRFDKNNSIKRKKEINYFNLFDGLIVHNRKMMKYLHNMGVKVKMYNLEIFDYLDDSLLNINAKYDVLFCGNLKKSSFVNKMSFNNITMQLIGIIDNQSFNKGIYYEGSFFPEELTKHVSAKYGLVWDGDSLDYCDGIYGEYLKINNPHKTSYYLSIGLPVIIWKDAALAEFIIENNLGFTIKNISELDQKVKGISLEDYMVMKNNVKKISKELKKGSFILNAIKETIEKV